MEYIYNVLIGWGIPVLGLLASINLYRKSQHYSIFVMLIGFGITLVSQFSSSFPITETISTSNLTSGVSLSFDQPIPVYDFLIGLWVPGLAIAVIGLFLFSLCIERTPNKSLNQDATNVAPIS